MDSRKWGRGNGLCWNRVTELRHESMNVLGGFTGAAEALQGCQLIFTTLLCKTLDENSWINGQ